MLRPFLLVLSMLAAAPLAAAGPELLAGKEWRVEAMAGEKIADGVEITLNVLPDGRLAGRAACNRFTGSATVGDGAIAVGPLASTRMACPAPLMALEATFLRLLRQAERYAMPASDRLEIVLRDGRKLTAAR
jgi:heat shock protein HslJ